MKRESLSCGDLVQGRNTSPVGETILRLLLFVLNSAHNLLMK